MSGVSISDAILQRSAIPPPNFSESDHIYQIWFEYISDSIRFQKAFEISTN